MANWGVPYQGSKGAHAHRIFRAIVQRSPEGSHLFDPFCGGFAVSHYFLAHGWSVTASDADCYQIALLEALLDGDGIPSLMNEWIPRSLFEQCRDDPDNTGLSDAEVQFVRLVWSFGYRGTSYLYGRPLEEVKRLIHELVVNGMHSDRLAALTKVPERQLQRVAALPAKSRYAGWRRAYSLSPCADRIALPLQSFESAQRIAQLELDQRPRILHASYEEALADLDGLSDIYLDPPYEGTESYAGSETFDHGQFWIFATGLAKEGHRVYVSEYNAPPDWKPVLAFSRPNQMAADPLAKTRHHREKLFMHRTIE